MRNFIFSLCLSLLSASAISQAALAETKRVAYGNPFSMSNENFINMTNAMSDNNHVSMMLFPDWQKLEIFGSDSSYTYVDSSNYHMQLDKILFVHNGNMYELFPEKIEKAHIGDHLFINRTYEKNKKELSRSFFEVLVEGDYQLLLKRKLTREVSNDSPLGLAATKKITYTIKTDMYYVNSSSSRTRPKDLPSKKADFVKIFRRDRQQVVDYAKANKLSPKKIEEAAALFTFYNALED